jgi:uncharacterized membrane protein
MIYNVLVYLHLFAALLWLGGMFFLGLVGAPVLRSIESVEMRQRLFNDLGVRFRNVGWAAIAVLLLTGMSILEVRGIFRSGAFVDAAFWRTPFGMALAVKLAMVASMVALSAYHDFALGPAAGRATPGSSEALSLRRKATMTARVSALLGLVLLYAATLLARS